MSRARTSPTPRIDDPLPGFQVAAVTVPLLYGPLIGLVVAAVLVLAGAFVTLPREQVTWALVTEAYLAVGVAGVLVSGVCSGIFGYPVARAMKARGIHSPAAYGAMGLLGGLAALAIWKVLVDRGLVFQPYFAPWGVAFPLYGAMYALLFRWRAAKVPARLRA
ncbi:MAG: hypothetical protein MUE41_14370 [Gemmatimonadaceae bacterium]|jgi:hypothetical protein|nr:hypothetical protein [Gemmatimonadaceae bacterium]